MYASVEENAVSFLSHYEGVCTFMYLDVKCLLTTGIGNLIDTSMNEDDPEPWRLATSLPWMKRGGSLASHDEIVAEWKRIKSLTSVAPQGGYAFAKFATLKLSSEGVQNLVAGKIEEMWKDLVDRFPDIGSWPADAQLGLLSMSWAAGQHFRAPHFDAACRALDFETASKECGLHTPRDEVNKRLFLNAAHVHEAGMDTSELHYPTIVLSQVTIEAALPTS